VSECQFGGDNPLYYAKKFLGEKRPFWRIKESFFIPPPIINRGYYVSKTRPFVWKRGVYVKKNFWKIFDILGEYVSLYFNDNLYTI